MTFRIIRIDFDDNERVESARAFTDSETVLTISRMILGGMDVLVNGPGGVIVQLPVATMTELYQATGKIYGNDPVYKFTHPVWESLSWVHCSLMDES